MTDRLIAERAVQANQIEQAARASLASLGGDEHECAANVLRQAVGLRKALESWISKRAMRRV